MFVTIMLKLIDMLFIKRRKNCYQVLYECTT